MRARALWRGLLLLACVSAGGCWPQESRHIGAVDPVNNIPAMEKAAHSRDRKAVPALVKQLDSDDPAIRFYAIEALYRITGQTFDYHYYDDSDARRPAVKRWQRWMAEQKIQ